MKGKRTNVIGLIWRMREQNIHKVMLNGLRSVEGTYIKDEYRERKVT